MLESIIEDQNISMNLMGDLHYSLFTGDHEVQEFNIRSEIESTYFMKN